MSFDLRLSNLPSGQAAYVFFFVKSYHLLNSLILIRFVFSVVPEA